MGAARFLLSPVQFATTCLDLWLVSQLVTYSPMVDDPPIRHLAESPIRQMLAAFEGEPRLWAPGGNLATILGASSTPPYFTFAPAVYTDRQRIMPDGDVSARIAWLKRAGVTHILTFDPLDETVWPVTKTWKQIDPFLNHVPGFFVGIAAYGCRIECKAKRSAGRFRGSPCLFVHRAAN